MYPIYLRIIINRKTKFYSTPFECKLSEWNEKTGEFNSKFRNHLTFNKALSKIKNDATDVIKELETEFTTYNIILFDITLQK